MAILKHTTSKNSNYNDALFYLLFEHDGYTMKPVLDEKGKMVRRQSYLLDGMNCNPFTYAEECRELNEQYHKNQTPGEIKAHHYIISFDPHDQDECGLTAERAQAIGMEYAQKNFPGHQAIICTHTDGHNSSGNIHVHIVINSLRKLDVEPQDFMERPCDSRAGYKHHQTRSLLTYLQKSLMEICNREGLHQVDLLTPSENKITEREYWAQKRGQEALDKTNEEVVAFGLTPAKTRFQTQKQFLRDAIADVSRTATSFEEFQKVLWENYSIRVTDKNVRYSYLHPERNKNMTERVLGTDYGKEHLMKLFEENLLAMQSRATGEPPEHLEVQQGTAQNARTDSNAEPTSSSIFVEPLPDYAAIFFVKSDLHLVVDLQNNVKAQQSRAYMQKVKLSNLKQMAQTVAYVQEQGYDSREDLRASYEEIVGKRNEARKTLRATEDKLKAVNEKIHYTGQYLSNKKTYGEMLKAKNKKKFRQEHSSEIALYESAVKFLKEHSPDGKIPSMKSLQQEKESLTIRRKAQQETYQYFKDYAKELKTVCANVDAILDAPQAKESERTKPHEIS
ncbi:MAG: relaxase/mobilization nuclease domain-containing protein [Lachnospiraceae bacterium]|nr:relaxase/mobilization nuclease domain-containing protein [Lachnospiraceae bacterium]